jgi:hypothetical protein
MLTTKCPPAILAAQAVRISHLRPNLQDILHCTRKQFLDAILPGTWNEV